MATRHLLGLTPGSVQNLIQVDQYLSFVMAMMAAFGLAFEVFGLSLPKLLVLAVIALVIFGPNELPEIGAGSGCYPMGDSRKYWRGRTAGQGTRPGTTTGATGLQEHHADAGTNLRARPVPVTEPVMKAQVVDDADVVTYVLACDRGDEAVAALAQFARSEQIGDTHEQEREHVEARRVRMACTDRGAHPR